jgi:hypothetical protein
MDVYSNGTMSESSKKVYMNNLSKLAGTKEFKTLDFLKNTDEIIKKIDAMNPNTARSYYIAIVSAIKGRRGFKKQETIYFNKQQEMNKTLGENSHKSDRTKEKYTGITWSDMVKRQDDLVEEYNKTKNQDTLLYLVIVSLYTLLPPRRLMDYTLMKIGNGTNPEFNYYDGSRFIFHHYKTSKSSKTQIEKVPDELVKLLSIYLKHKKFPDSPFLLHASRSPSVSNSTQMNSLLRKAFNNDKVGASLLRGVYLTSKYGDMMKDLREDTKAMGTSEQMASDVYIQK